MCGGAEGHFGLMTQHVVGKRGQSSGLPQRQLPSKSRGMRPARTRLRTGHRSVDDRLSKLHQTPEVTQAKGVTRHPGTSANDCSLGGHGAS